MLPGLAYASQCGSVKGQNNFTISFDVEGDDEYQALNLDQGSHGYVLWYTGNKKNNTERYDYLFNEQELVDDDNYNIKITHLNDSNLLSYYRKTESATNYELVKPKCRSKAWTISDY
ncbi:hypothetical protein D1115_01980 [Vibrio alfacsensis]|uniref:Uncharacterized protein n=1 Tax=Vibrio alfacsensis TaxID=1074311 RepID=A0ABN5PAZ4_9VIBR|nr:hypothetical protein [Vibrio alfacsensis]AXY00195.1 hypothetical protein D1115_01980 [Vibrio alfacsensis]